MATKYINCDIFIFLSFEKKEEKKELYKRKIIFIDHIHNIFIFYFQDFQQ